MTEFEVYAIFRRCQANFYNRPYRLPKDWDKHFNTRMSEYNRKCLEKATRCFNTIWANIDPERYFTYGFVLFNKAFTYKYFFDKRLINLYKEKDKILKRENDVRKADILRSATFIKSYLKENNITLIRYLNTKSGNLSLPILHYIKGKIGKELIVWFLSNGKLIITDEERGVIPYITNSYRKTLSDLNMIKDFMEKTEAILGEIKCQ